MRWWVVVVSCAAGCTTPSALIVGETAAVLPRAKVAVAAAGGVGVYGAGGANWAAGGAARLRVGVGARQEVGATVTGAAIGGGGGGLSGGLRYKLSPWRGFAFISELSVGSYVVGLDLEGNRAGYALLGGSVTFLGSTNEERRARLYGGLQIGLAGSLGGVLAVGRVQAPLGVAIRVHRYADLFIEGAVAVHFADGDSLSYFGASGLLAVGFQVGAPAAP